MTQSYTFLSRGSSSPALTSSLPREILLFLLDLAVASPSPSGSRASLYHPDGANCTDPFPTPLERWHTGTANLLLVRAFTLWKLANITNPTFFSPRQEPAYNCFLPSVCHRASEPPRRESLSAPSLVLLAPWLPCEHLRSRAVSKPSPYPNTQLRTWSCSGT